MRLRTFTVSLIAAAAATLPLAGVAAAQPGDRDCADFSSQAEAQDALDSRAGDPERLDADDDGEACESHDYGTPAPSEPTTPPTSEPITPPTEDEAVPPTNEPTTPPADHPHDDTHDETTGDEARDDEKPAQADADSDDDAGQVAVIPRGGVDTGDGSTEGPTAPLLIGGVVALGAVAAAGRYRANRSR